MYDFSALSSYYEKILATGEVKCIDDEIPFEIPETWQWGRLGNVINLLSGRDLQPNEYNSKGNGIPYMTGASNFEYGKLIINRWTMNPVTISSLGDILITCKGTIGEIAINNIGEIHIARQIMAISSKIVYMPYLKIYIASLISMLKAKAKSIIPGISRDNLLNALISIPPICEQQKIAKKYSVIQPYIEAYNIAEMQTKEIETNILQNLYYSILQYAIQGRLVKQDERDGTAFDLLEQIQKEKAELVTEGKLKKSELKTSVIYRGDDNKYWEKKDNELMCIDDEIPFDIPDSWKWVRFSTIANFSLGKTPERANKAFWNPEKYPWVSIADMEDKSVLTKTKEQISEKALVEKFNGTLSPVGTLIMSFKLTIGKVSILGIEATHNEAIISIFPYVNTDNIMRDYLFNILALTTSYTASTDAIKGSTLNSKKIADMLIPLPPLYEQKRIILALDKVLASIMRK